MSTSTRILYIVIMVTSVTAAFMVARKTQGKSDLTRKERIALGIGALAGAMLAAKLPFLLSDPHGFVSGRAWLDNGRTLTLGLVGGYFGVEATKLAIGIEKKTGDGFVVPVASGVAIGRLGCFVGGCCFGIPTALPWGVDFGDGIHRHPTQLYELAFHASAIVFFTWAKSRGLFVRQRMKLYVISYFVYRFVTEFIRPEPRALFSLTMYQWSAIIFVPVFAWLYLREHRASQPAPPQPPHGRVDDEKNARTSS
jgi:phosphatidylglycerol:prolipoprotein diacylglycerol transferase